MMVFLSWTICMHCRQAQIPITANPYPNLTSCDVTSTYHGHVAIGLLIIQAVPCRKCLYRQAGPTICADSIVCKYIVVPIIRYPSYTANPAVSLQCVAEPTILTQIIEGPDLTVQQWLLNLNIRHPEIEHFAFGNNIVSILYMVDTSLFLIYHVTLL